MQDISGWQMPQTKTFRMLEINSKNHERHYSRELKEKEPMKWVGLRYLLQNYWIGKKFILF